MPIYEYECMKCEKWFEELIMGEDDERGLKCPGCASKKVERRFSSFSTHDTSPGAHFADPSKQREDMIERSEKPTVGMDHLDQYFDS